MIDFLYEMGNLKRVKRSGWWLLNIKDPESVAEHSFRTAVIGYLLAKTEGADEKKVMLCCLFNDSHESRINDLHKVGQRYIDFSAAEDRAFLEQISSLPKNIQDELAEVHNDFKKETTIEGSLARDADLLECAMQAREYVSIGVPGAQSWIDNVKKIIKTDAGKNMLSDIEKTDPNAWWKGLKSIKR